MTTRNQVWSNNGDIANDLEWPLTAPSAHFCKFWGFCPFYPTHFSDVCKPTFSKLLPMTWLYSKKEALLYEFPTSAPYQKWGRKTPKFRKGSAAMLLNHYISAAVRVWRGYAVRPSWPFRTLKICKFWKSKMAAAAILKIGKSPYLGSSSSDFDEIWHSVAVPPAWPFWPLENWNFANPSCELICIGALT